jgi:hypothetical protein
MENLSAKATPENLRSILEKRFYELKAKEIQPYAKFKTYKAYLKTKDIKSLDIKISKPQGRPKNWEN